MQNIFEIFKQKFIDQKLSTNSHSKKLTKGFSLVELAIVILIIGILVVGVSQGYNVVRSAQISNARGITAKSPIPSFEDLYLWYETSLKNSFLESEQKNTGQITKWKDISPASILNGYNISSTSGTNNITYLASGINKIPAVYFSGTGSKLTLSGFAQGVSSQTTIFIVFRPTYSPTANYITLFDNSTASNYSISINNSSVQLNNGTTANFNTVFNLNQDYIIACYFNRGNSQVFVNSLTSLGTASLTGTNSLVGATIGNSFAGTASFNGLISELVVYNRVIKEAERQEIFYYLNKKYKIEIEKSESTSSPQNF